MTRKTYHLYIYLLLNSSQPIIGLDTNTINNENKKDITPNPKPTNFRTDEHYISKLLKAYNIDEKDQSSKSSILDTTNAYGMDVSFCIQDDEIFFNDLVDGNGVAIVPDDKKRGQKRYEKFLDGCRLYYDLEQDIKLCIDHEIDRVERNIAQPPSMKNFTDIGFQKCDIPKRLTKKLSLFWENMLSGIDHFRDEYEKWPIGSTYVNHWVSTTHMVELPQELKAHIIDTITPIVQQFLDTKEELMVASMYGIRIYGNTCIVSPHVDLLPFVATAVLNVAQLAEEDWPIELYAHDGYAYNVTLNPGEMLLYEGHSIIHGRPFPFTGEYYANIYIHFEPVGYSIKQEEQSSKKKVMSPKEKYESKLMERQSPGYKKVTHQVTPIIPPYIQKDTPEEKRWLQKFPDNHMIHADDAIHDYSDIKELLYPEEAPMSAHQAAKIGDLATIKKFSPRELRKKDNNGWQPIHEAARAGHVKVLEYLVEYGGADVDFRTNFGRGGSPLYWAKTSLGKDHEIVKKLESYGATYIEPNFEDSNVNSNQNEKDKSNTNTLENNLKNNDENSFRYRNGRNNNENTRQ